MPTRIEDSDGGIVWWADRVHPYGLVGLHPSATIDCNCTNPLVFVDVLGVMHRHRNGGDPPDDTDPPPRTNNDHDGGPPRLMSEADAEARAREAADCEVITDGAHAPGDADRNFDHKMRGQQRTPAAEAWQPGDRPWNDD